MEVFYKITLKKYILHSRNAVAKNKQRKRKQETNKQKKTQNLAGSEIRTLTIIQILKIWCFLSVLLQCMQSRILFLIYVSGNDTRPKRMYETIALSHVCSHTLYYDPGSNRAIKDIQQQCTYLYTYIFIYLRNSDCLVNSLQESTPHTLWA